MDSAGLDTRAEPVNAWLGHAQRTACRAQSEASRKDLRLPLLLLACAVLLCPGCTPAPETCRIVLPPYLEI